MPGTNDAISLRQPTVRASSVAEGVAVGGKFGDGVVWTDVGLGAAVGGVAVRTRAGVGAGAGAPHATASRAMRTMNRRPDIDSDYYGFVVISEHTVCRWPDLGVGFILRGPL